MLEDTLQHVQQWMNLNHLKLNTDKTELIYFGHYKQLKKCTVQEINVCEDIVNRKESICYLGLTIDENLSFKNHISRYTLDWLPIKYRILYKILCLAFKCIHGLGPSYLNEMLVQNILQRRLRSNSTNEITYTVPRNKNKTFGDRSFSFCRPYEWNNHPNELKCTIMQHLRNA